MRCSIDADGRRAAVLGLQRRQRRAAVDGLGVGAGPARRRELGRRPLRRRPPAVGVRRRRALPRVHHRSGAGMGADEDRCDRPHRRGRGASAAHSRARSAGYTPERGAEVSFTWVIVGAGSSHFGAPRVVGHGRRTGSARQRAGVRSPASPTPRTMAATSRSASRTGRSGAERRTRAHRCDPPRMDLHRDGYRISTDAGRCSTARRSGAICGRRTGRRASSATSSSAGSTTRSRSGSSHRAGSRRASGGS